ncbi:MAG: V-type ATP synthase subunit I [archaeon]
MLRPHKISKVTIFGLKQDREAILARVQETGLFQPMELKRQDDLNKPLDVKTLKLASDNLIRVSRLVNVLKLAPQKQGFIQNVLGLDLLDKRVVEKNRHVLDDSESFLKKHEAGLVQLEEQHNELREREEELRDFKGVVDLFGRLSIPMEHLESTKRLSIVTGKMATEFRGQLEKELRQKLDEHVHFISGVHNKKESVVTIVCLKEHAADVSFLLKKYSVSVFTIPSWGMKKAPAGYIIQELSRLESERRGILKQIARMRKEIYEDSVVLREELEVLKQRYETIHSMLDSQKFFVMRGWAREDMVAKVELALSSKAAVVSEDPGPEDEVPIELSNGSILRPFEMLTELYALPKYRDIDPTFIVGPVFLVFAAFMLTDAIYGAFLVMMGAYMLLKFAKYNEGLKQVSIIITGMGVLTVFFGILTGSYFGDFPKYLWGIEPDHLALWKDPLADPLYFLVLAIGVAVVYLNVGFVLGAVEDFRKRDFKTMFKERIVWFLIQAGIALVALGINPYLFTVMGKDIGLAVLIIILTILSIIITHGPLGLLGITGLMGDMISFSRLFALSLSTAGIALAVNLLANLVVGFPWVGIILAAIVFIIGHMFGFVMNSIGSFVHSLRLQFVEFFGRFYEGGGDRFTPLREERYYTEVRK